MIGADIPGMSLLMGPPSDAAIAHNFQVILGGDIIGDFYGVDGLGKSIGAMPYKELGRLVPMQLIDHGSYSNVILKWGRMDRNLLWRWMQEVEFGGQFRKDLVIMQLTRSKFPTRTFVVAGAFPVRWSGGTMDSNSTTIAVEEIELAYHALEMVAI